MGQGGKGVDRNTTRDMPEANKSMPRKIQAVLKAKGGHTKY